MKVALIVYPGARLLDLAAVAEPLGEGQVEAIYCCAAPLPEPASGLSVVQPLVRPDLAQFDAIVVPSAADAQAMRTDADWLAWLASAQPCPFKAAVGSGAALLAAAGLLMRRTGADSYRVELNPVESYPQGERYLLANGTLVAQNSAAALDLGLALCQRLSGDCARSAAEASLSGPTYLPIPVTAVGRTSLVERSTRETQIRVALNLDGSGQAEIQTGLGFFDHMLHQIAAHGLFDLTLQAQGDLHIDPHHTVEDTGLALGMAFDRALGDRKGIVRMASTSVPMDESLATVVVDLSGRPYSVLRIPWNGPSVGSLPGSLIEHFLESFALQARCNLHVSVPYGRDDHHIAEAVFKALARALDAATALDPRRAGQIPSTKGAL